MSEVQNSAMAGDSQFSHALQDDGREHPRGDKLAYLCLVLGVITLALALGEKWDIATAAHWIGLGIGLIGFLLSPYVQMTSATTRERWILMPGWILCGTFGALNFWFAIS